MPEATRRRCSRLGRAVASSDAPRRPLQDAARAASSQARPAHATAREVRASVAACARGRRLDGEGHLVADAYERQDRLLRAGDRVAPDPGMERQQPERRRGALDRRRRARGVQVRGRVSARQTVLRPRLRRAQRAPPLAHPRHRRPQDRRVRGRVAEEPREHQGRDLALRWAVHGLRVAALGEDADRVGCAARRREGRWGTWVVGRARGQLLSRRLARPHVHHLGRTETNDVGVRGRLPRRGLRHPLTEDLAEVAG